MACNICLGCNSVPDVNTCDKTDCFAYDQRKTPMAMDHEYNKNSNLVIYREQIKLGIRASTKQL